MEVLFESRNAEDVGLRELAVRRARFVLRRLAWLVPTAKVRLSDANGPRGGIDKCCNVELQTHARVTVVAHSHARDWRAAVDSALARAARLLLRASRRAHAAGPARRPALEFRG